MLKETVYLCIAQQGDVVQLIKNRIEKHGFHVVESTNLGAPRAERFNANREVIKQSDLLMAVLKDCGISLAMEVGLAHALGMQTIGINYDLRPAVIQIYYALDQLITPEELEDFLSGF